MLELVIFDCDGVLVDSEPISNRVLAQCLTEIGLPTSVEESMAAYMGRWWPDCVEIIEARLGRPLPEGFSEAFRERQVAALAAEVEPVSGVVAALDRIGIDVCVASNGPPEKMRATLGRSGLLERFRDRIFSAAEIGSGKPAPDLFLHAAASAGHEPRRCAVIEDSVLGIEAARAAGMRAFGFHAGGDIARLEAAGAVGFASMSELPGLLGLDPEHAAHGH